MAACSTAQKPIRDCVPSQPDTLSSSSTVLPVVDPTREDSLVLVVLGSLLPLLVMGIVVAAMFYWYRVHRPRMHSQEWESGIKKRKAKSGGLDCSDVCVTMMDDDRSDISSTHANSLNHNTEPLPIELDQLVRTLNIWSV